MRCLLLILPLLALFSGTAQATIILRADVNDLTDTATVVVRGEVLSVESKWTEDESGKTIQTLAVLRVDRVLKGTAGKEITVTCPGGAVGRSEVRVAGTPKFKKGEKVVVFLWKNRYGDYLPLGMNQGKFRIEKDAKSGEERAKNSLEGLALVGAPDGRGGQRKVKKTADNFSLPALEKRITDRVETIRKAAAAKKAAEAAAKKAAEEKKRAEDQAKTAGTGEEKAEPEKKPVPPVKPEPEKKTEPEEK